MAKTRIKPGKRVKLSNHYYRDEFACKDHCGFNTVDYNLVVILEKMCNELGRKLVVVEGCMCSKRAKVVGGNGDNAHLLGKGAHVIAPIDVLKMQAEMTNTEICKAIDKVFGDVIYYYPIDGGKAVHIDSTTV